PIKWIGDRREDLLTSTQAWDEDIDAELGLDADGRIRGLRAKVWADVGAYSIHPWTASIEVIQVVSFLPGPYRVPHYHGQAWGVRDQQGADGPLSGCRPAGVDVRDGSPPRSRRPPARHGSGGHPARQPDPRRRAAVPFAFRSRLGFGELHGIADARMRGCGL